MTDLVATTLPLSVAPDLLAEAGADGFLWRDEHGGLAAHGVALRLTFPSGLADPRAVAAVGDTLAAVRGDDQVGLPGCGPVAIGALPFDPNSPGALVVPRRIVGRSGDKGWVTTIESTADSSLNPSANAPAPPPGTAGAPEPESPDRFTLASSLSHAEWQEVIATAVEVLRRGELDKVVLARRIDITANRPFVVTEVLERLVALYPSCMVFNVDGFLGASPELLISRTGDRVETHPLAGTVARSGDSHADEALVASLLASPKARHEHRVVIDFLEERLGTVCDDLNVPEEPSVLGLRNVSHLATRIRGRLAGGDTRPTALELVARVHPTPAVGGTPTSAAIEYLRRVEGFDRDRYAGPVGWVDSRGDGAWAIGIRSAEVSGATARIYAGNGIVAASSPAEELAETQLKLQALLAALVRP